MLENYNNNIGFLVFIIILFIIGFIILVDRSYNSVGYTLVYLSLLLYLTLFYDSLDEKDTENKNNFYRNHPVGIYVIYISLPFYIYILGFLYKHTLLFGNNITTKQDASIKQFKKVVEEKNINFSQNELGYFYITNNFKKFEFKKCLSNIIKLYCMKVPKSKITIK